MCVSYISSTSFTTVIYCACVSTAPRWTIKKEKERAERLVLLFAWILFSFGVLYSHSCDFSTTWQCAPRKSNGMLALSICIGRFIFSSIKCVGGRRWERRSLMLILHWQSISLSLSLSPFLTRRVFTRLSQLMPPKPKEDVSSRVFSPMPGTIVSLSVQPGSQVCVAVFFAISFTTFISFSSLSLSLSLSLVQFYTFCFPHLTCSVLTVLTGRCGCRGSCDWSNENAE